MKNWKGDMLGVRIIKDSWIIPDGFCFRAVLWGLLGMMITLALSVYTEGIAGAHEIGKLPFEGSHFALALFSSIVMNLTFGPMLYIRSCFFYRQNIGYWPPHFYQFCLESCCDYQEKNRRYSITIRCCLAVVRLDTHLVWSSHPALR